MTQNHRSLARVTSEFIGKPIAITPQWATVLVSSVRQKLNIRAFTDIEGITFDALEMDQNVIEARSDVDSRNARRGRGKDFTQYNSIAVIEVVGTLTRKWGLDPHSGFTGHDGIKAKIIAANDDESVKGILIDVDCSGGPIAGLFDLADFIYQFSARMGGKPIWVIANEIMCSAAYIAFSAADRIIATRTATLGSIACMMMYENVQGSLDKEGIKVNIFRSLPLKVEANPFEELKPEAADRIQKELEVVQQMINDTVARNRSSTDSEFSEFKKKVSEMAGLTYMGNEARDMGLADDIMSEDQVWEEFTQFLNK